MFMPHAAVQRVMCGACVPELPPGVRPGWMGIVTLRIGLPGLQHHVLVRRPGPVNYKPFNADPVTRSNRPDDVLLQLGFVNVALTGLGSAGPMLRDRNHR